MNVNPVESFVADAFRRALLICFRSLPWLRLRWCALSAAWLVLFGSVQATEELGIVRLRDGTVFKGRFSSQPTGPTADSKPLVRSFDWMCPTFTQALTIPWDGIEAVSLVGGGSQGESPLAEGDEASEELEFVFEFWNGGCLTGQIKSIDSEYVEIESVRFPVQRVELAKLRTILRVQKGEARDAGVLPAAGWVQTVPAPNSEQKPAWQLQVDALKTQTAGAQIRFPVFIPEVCSIEIDTAWNHSNPNWIFTVGDPRQLQLHLRKLEHRNALAITLLFEESQNADISTAIVPFDGLESIKLRILADYIRGRFALELAGKTIAEIRGKEKKRSGGLQPILFTNNTTGGISLRDVRVSRSVFSLEDNAAEQRALIGEPPTVILKNSEEYVGGPADFNPLDASFGFAGSASLLGRVRLEDIERIEFHDVSAEAHQERLMASREASFYAVELRNGGCFTGSELDLQGEQIRLTGTSLAQPIVCSLSDIASIRIRNSNLTPPEEPVDGDGTVMRLVTDHAISRGCLADDSRVLAQFPGSKGGLYWESKQILRVAQIAASVDGTIDIVTGDTGASPRMVPDLPVVSQASLEASGRYLLPGEPALYLASGDAVPAVVSSISDGEVKGTSTYFGDFAIPSVALRGYRLLAYTGSQSMDAGVVKRLLTIPRLQRDNPPQHLIVSREGDAVRGTLAGFSPDRISMQVRDKEQAIDTKNVAEIVWLASPETELVPEIPSEPPIHVIMAHGTSIRVVPDKVLDKQIVGRHALLGGCALPFRDCKRILLGSKIEEGLRSNHFTRWKLRHAIDPRFIQREQEAAAVASGESKWIGKNSPSWTLERLDAPLLESHETQGQVVVLTFWNSGSDACLEWLPEAAAALSEFSSREVRFVAVNNMENAQIVRAATVGMDLPRLHPDLIFALDRDGAVARSFEILAMPYTVVIGRDGKIAQVLMGNETEAVPSLLNAVSAELHSVVVP